MKKDVMENVSKTYPVNLLPRGRRAVVVGGGKVAARKVAGLAETDSEILVVAPEVRASIEALTDSGRVSVRRRGFEDGDLDGAFLAFAATGDAALNRRVMDACDTRGVLCCAVDSNWPEGDFIKPASFDKGGLSVAVSTHGASCRQAKLVKRNLERHVDAVSALDLLVLGTDHNYLPLEGREKFHLAGRRFDGIGGMVARTFGVHEFLLLDTCNRVELWAVVSPSDELEEMLEFLMGFTDARDDSYYLKRGGEAFAHSASVVAGLMSQTPGEKHVVAQVKDALAKAMAREWADAAVRGWVDASLMVSKKIRVAIDDVLRRFEIEDVAMEYLEKESGGISGKKALVVGTGEMGRAIALSLSDSGADVVGLYRSNEPSRDGMSASVSFGRMNDLKEELQSADIVVCAASAEAPLLHQGHAPFLDGSKRILIVDLAMPRNVASELSELMPNVKVADLDDLKYWRRRESADMARVFEISRGVIESHMDVCGKIIGGADGGRD
jgi:glutamyl-tRNA reductase